jgi:hypothetical protein
VREHKWIARPYKEGDEEQIFELRRAVYPDWKGDQEELYILIGRVTMMRG